MIAPSISRVFVQINDIATRETDIADDYFGALVAPELRRRLIQREVRREVAANQAMAGSLSYPARNTSMYGATLIWVQPMA